VSRGPARGRAGPDRLEEVALVHPRGKISQRQWIATALLIALTLWAAAGVGQSPGPFSSGALPVVYPALVPEGESEEILGVAWGNGQPVFRRAPLLASPKFAVAWSPDGGQLATGSGLGLVQLWDATNGRELRRLEGHSDLVRSVAWSPDGMTLASASADRTVRLWNASNGQELRCLEGQQVVASVGWSPDSKTIAVGGQDKMVRVYHAVSGQELHRFRGHQGEINSVAWSPDGNLVASASWDGTVRLWDVANGRELHRLERLKGHHNPVNSVAWSPNGKELASAGADKTIRLWDAATGAELRHFEGHQDTVVSLAWSRHGTALASASIDRTVRLWDPESGAQLGRLQGHLGKVLSVAWSPGAQVLASAGEDSTVRLWHGATGQEFRRIEGDSDGVSAVAWSPDGSTLASVAIDATVRLWDPFSGTELRRLASFSASLRSIAWSADGKTLALASADRKVRLCDAASGHVLHTLDGHGAEVTSVAWSHDGRILASTSADGTLRLWDVESGREIVRLDGHTAEVSSFAWSPDDKTLASASADRTVRFWDATSGRELRRLQHYENAVISLAWSPDGKTVATASTDTTARLWDAVTGQPLRLLKGHENWVQSVAWSPDGKVIATASADTTVRLWDTASGRELRRLEGHRDSVASVAWSPDGKVVASAGGDGTVRLWSPQNHKAPLAVALWAGSDGWVAWRAALPKERRVMRGENGNLIRRPAQDGTLQAVPPGIGLAPQLSVKAELVRPASPGEMGQAIVRVTNQSQDSPALWVEVRIRKEQIGLETLALAFKLPSVALRLEPGATASLPVGYFPQARDNPRPDLARVTFQVHHCHDGGKSTDDQAVLRYQSANITMNVGQPFRDLAELVIPATLANSGNQPTSHDLQVAFAFLLPDGGVVESHKSVVYQPGVSPGEVKSLSLAVPKRARDASQFRVRLTARHVARSGVGAGFSYSEFLAKWTQESEWLRVEPLDWLVVLALLFVLLAVAAFAGFAVRLWRCFYVPWREAQFTAETLGATLGNAIGQTRDRKLGLSRVLDALADLRDGHTRVWEFTLPVLRLDFQNKTAITVLVGKQVVKAQVRRMTRMIRLPGPGSALLIDLTKKQNAREALYWTEEFAPVVLARSERREVLCAESPTRALEVVIANQRPLRELSPFRAAGGVDNPTMFFGRDAELKNLTDHLRQNVFLAGVRQMGKSSLLKALARRLAQRGDVEVLYLALGSPELMSAVAFELKQSAPESLEAFQAMVRGTKERPRVWLIDEADGFVMDDLKRSGEVCWALRSLSENGVAYFVLAGFSETFLAANSEADSPLKNFGRVMQLGPLDGNAARRLIKEPMQTLGIALTEDVVGRIVHETGRRANLVVRACQELVNTLGPEQRSVNLNDLEAVWEKSDLSNDVSSLGSDPLDRAVGHAAFSLERPTREQIEKRLKESGICLHCAELKLSLERLERGYVLVRQSDGSGQDQWCCPVPLIVRYERRPFMESGKPWDEHLRRDAEELARSRSVQDGTDRLSFPLS
jgi:WD40 repeat protein